MVFLSFCSRYHRQNDRSQETIGFVSPERGPQRGDPEISPNQFRAPWPVEVTSWEAWNGFKLGNHPFKILFWWFLHVFASFLGEWNYDNLPRSWLMMCEKGTLSTAIPKRRFCHQPPLTALRCWYFLLLPMFLSLSWRVIMSPSVLIFLIGFRKILNWAILSLSCFYVAGHFARNGADKKTSCPIWCDDPTAGVSLTVGPPVSHNAFNVGSDHGQDIFACPPVSSNMAAWKSSN